jgi:hypothetical protein
MDLRYFFEGSLDHEVSSSAFLAMLLHGSTRFREAFLDAVLDGAPHAECAPWHVDVELDQVDVTMRCDHWLVLIENKIQAGAIRRDQLHDYYLHAREKPEEHRRIAAVLVAPQGMGRGVVGRVEEVKASDDAVKRLSWQDDIARLMATIPAGPERQVADSGFNQVLRIIKERQDGLLPTSEREEVKRIGAWALEDIGAARPDVRMMPFEMGPHLTLMTPKTRSFALFVNLLYPTGGTTGKEPLTHLAEGEDTVTLQSRFRQGSTVKADTDLGARWRDRTDEFIVPGVGLHRRAIPGGWFDLSQTCTGTSEEIAARMAVISIAVIDAVRTFEAEG